MSEHLREHLRAYLVSSIVLGLLGLCVFLVYEQFLYNAEHHCEPTGNHYEEYTFLYMGDGKGNTTIIPQTIIHVEMQCDNGRVWE